MCCVCHFLFSFTSLSQEAAANTECSGECFFFCFFSLWSLCRRHRSLIVSKGAPEVIEEFLTHKPEWYSRCHRFYTLKGCRVLALAWREAATESGDSDVHAQHLARSEVETNLRFAGFLMFKCHLKRDAKPMVKQVRDFDQSWVLL